MPVLALRSTRAAASRARPLVCFIEDNLTQLDLYAMVLREQVDVVTATRGEDGYVVACAERPDAILLDALLPDVNGLTLTERLRASPDTASTPVIVLTGSDEAYAHAYRMRSELTGS